MAIVLGLSKSTNALNTLFSAATIMPALSYLGTVLLFLKYRNSLGAGTSHIEKKWEFPVAILALIWLLFELSCLIFPSQFRSAQYYVLGTLGVGLVMFLIVAAQKRNQIKQ
jgi:hypothetical protein